MLTTIITSTNFKSFVKSLSKKSKFTTSSIPLLTAQEILAETFFYRNHHELIQSVKNDSFVDIHLNQETYSNISNRFFGILKKYDIQLDDESANSLFISTFGLEENRKLSIVDILKELIAIRDMPDSQMDKFNFFYIGEKMRFLHSHDFRAFKNSIVDEEDYDYDKNVLDEFKSSIIKDYPNIVENTFFYSNSFLNRLKNLNPSKKIQNRFLELLNTLFSYSSDELLKTFESNPKCFLIYGPKTFIISLNIRPEHILINQSVFEQKYILLEKEYIENNDFLISPVDNLFILHNDKMKESTYTKYFKYAKKYKHKRTEKCTFNNYDSAIRHLIKINSQFKYVVVPVNKLLLGHDYGAFHFKEYFGLENGQIYQYSMKDKTKSFV